MHCTLGMENHGERAGRFIYTCDQLCVPKELLIPYRGCRAGCKTKAKRIQYKHFMGNVQSLGNKMEELNTLIRTQREYWECSVISFTEKRLHKDILDSSFPGFQTETLNWVVRGEGVELFGNNRWCNPGHVNVKEHNCCPNVEFLAVGLPPYYLPRDFIVAIVVSVYTPPAADAEATQNSASELFRCYFWGF